MKNRILIVAAHPDDEILGCGASIARLVEEGAEAFTLILGEGATSRDDKRERDKHEKEIQLLKQNIREANSVLGVKETFSMDFPDNRFDSVDLLDIVKAVEKIKNEVKPDTIFTHYRNDLNIDHSITNRAVLTATRPQQNETVKQIFAYEVLSSTEWNFPLSFLPDFYIEVDCYLERKKEAMRLYQNELCDFPHPRSIEAIELNAGYWGMRTGLNRAEVFKTLRRIL